MSRDRSGIVLFYSVAGILLLAIGLLIWAALQLRHRRTELGEVDLQRTRQLVHIRLDGLFQEMAEDLREEAAALDLTDSTLVHQRWYSLLRTHWPILSVRLADENGDEIALIREDSTYLLSHTVGGSKDGPPILLRYVDPIHDPPIEGPWLDETDYDPRERFWFSKALENDRSEPSWTVRPPLNDGPPLLQVSYLIRREHMDLPFQIMAFSIDLTRSSWMDTHSAALARSGILLMDDEGRSLGQVSRPVNGTMAKAMEEATRIWKERENSSPFTVNVDGREFRCLVGTYPLNGQELHTGVVMDMAQVNAWFAPERTALMVIGGFLAVIIALLIWAWRRKRTADERLRKQAKRNRTQEVKLAKALGEREVLNREVHHRVKNNLQVVSSLLNLQAMRLDDGPVKNEFLRGKRRIDTIALVHHKLYGLADLRNVDLSIFFTDLVKALAEMHMPRSRTVSFDVDTEDTKADQDTAIELGIILCELVANTYQHAFPYATGGYVEIRVRPVEGNLYRLTVKDNGKGIQESGARGAGKLGLEIVEALAEQLDGSFHMRSNGGVLFEVLFRMQRGSHSLAGGDHDSEGGN